MNVKFYISVLMTLFVFSSCDTSSLSSKPKIDRRVSKNVHDYVFTRGKILSSNNKEYQVGDSARLTFTCDTADNPSQGNVTLRIGMLHVPVWFDYAMIEKDDNSYTMKTHPSSEKKEEFYAECSIQVEDRLDPHHKPKQGRYRSKDGTEIIFSISRVSKQEALTPDLEGLVVIKGIDPDSQAEKLGFKQRDVLLSYDGKAMHCNHDLKRAAKQAQNKEKIEVRLKRRDQEIVKIINGGKLGIYVENH